MNTRTRDYAFEQLLNKEEVIRGAESANEATTRLRAIDVILFDVLGWDRLRVDSERYCRDVGYADYAFFQGDDICSVLEAKRSSETFILPAREYDERPVGFALLANECPPAETAMIQAAGYAASLGARYVAVSNGTQWILALTYVPQQPIAQRSVFVFESFTAMRDRFDLFFRCFGPAGVYSNAPAESLLEVRKAPAPAKLSASIPNYPVPATRNVFANEIGYVIDLVWDQMDRKETSEEFLRECYIPPPASQDDIAVATELFALRQRTDDRVRSEAHDAGDVSEMIAAPYSPEKPIVVLGRIGHGKSTFLKYLRLIKAKDELKNYVQIDIDFLDRPDVAGEVAPFIYSEVCNQLLTKYSIDVTDDALARGVLHSELQRYKNSSSGKLYASDVAAYRYHEVEYIESLQRDLHSYLGQVFRHLRRGRGKSIAMFLDNLDRRDDLHETAFLKASALARDWECLVFICLRPLTFRQSRDQGVLDSIAPKTITVVSPPTHILLKKRFHYARKIAEGTSVESSMLVAPSKDISFRLPTVAQLLECCEDSFFKNKKLTQVFEAVSNGNVRSLLYYVRQFLTSLHLDTQKIVDRAQDPDGYRIPDHEATRALLYGDFVHYDPAHSVFVNLFDLTRADPSEHFTRFLLLHFLNRLSFGPPQRGYCFCEEVLQYLCQIGYSAEHVRETLAFLTEKDCCELRVPGGALSAVDAQVRATTLGRYHVNHLANAFQYMDAITIDTPVLSADARGEIGDAVSIRDRLDRCRKFIDYLNECSETLNDAQASELWQATYSSVTTEISDIAYSLTNCD